MCWKNIKNQVVSHIQAKEKSIENLKFVFSSLSKKSEIKIEEGQAVGCCCWMNNFQKCKRCEKNNIKTKLYHIF